MVINTVGKDNDLIQKSLLHLSEARNRVNEAIELMLELKPLSLCEQEATIIAEKCNHILLGLFEVKKNLDEKIHKGMP